MAGELASAIALQSQPYNRPQSVGPSEGMIDNAFNGRRRADEERKQKEDAEKDKRLDAIMKNSVFTKQYENDYFNRVSQQQMAKAMDEVLQAYESGDENVGVVGARAVNKLQQIHQTLYGADKSMSAAQKAYDKDPNSLGVYNDQQVIGGKPFSNVFQAINSAENDALIPETADKYWSPGTEIMEREIAGEKIWVPQFVPGGAVTTDPFSLVEKDVNNPDNATWLNPVPETFKLGDTTVQSHKFQIEPTVAAKLAAQGMSSPESINYILDQDYRRRKQEAEAAGKTWTRKQQAQLPPVENTETIKRYAEDLTSKIHGRVGRRERIQDSPPQQKESAAKKALSEMTISVASNGRGGAKATFNKPGSIIKGNVVLPPDATIRTARDNGKGEEVEGLYKVGRELQLKEATPTEIVFNGLQNAHIKYIADTNEEGVDNGKTNEYVVPLTEQSFSALTTMLGVDNADEVIKMIQGASGANQYEFINEWLSKWGKQMPSGREAPKKMDAQGKTYEDDKVNKWRLNRR